MLTSYPNATVYTSVVPGMARLLAMFDTMPSTLGYMLTSYSTGNAAVCTCVTPGMATGYVCACWSALCYCCPLVILTLLQVPLMVTFSTCPLHTYGRGGVAFWWQQSKVVECPSYVVQVAVDAEF